MGKPNGKNKTEAAPVQPRSIWSTDFAVNADAAALGIMQPLPFIWLVGEKGTGKTSFMHMIDPAYPGESPRTLITDLEMSSTTISTQLSVDVVNIREIAAQKHGFNYRAGQLFEVWQDYVMSIPAGKYTVLGVDPASDLHQGCFQWVGEHPEVFGKTKENYRGTMGTFSQWGDAAQHWKKLSLELAARFQTTVFTSHVADVYAKGETGKKTGEKKQRGADFAEIASLWLWLTREKDGRLWAKVEKSRLNWLDKGTPENPRRRPLMHAMFPLRLEPKGGMSYPELLDSYMAKPSADYGELNTLAYDPTIAKETQAEREEREIDLLRERQKQAMIEQKREMINRLVSAGLYKDANAVALAVTGNEQYAEWAGSLETLPKLEAALRSMVQHEPQP